MVSNCITIRRIINSYRLQACWISTIGFETVGQDLEATSGDHTDQKHVFYRNVKKTKQKKQVNNDLTVQAQRKKKSISETRKLKHLHN